jgi:hypothetical protein
MLSQHMQREVATDRLAHKLGEGSLQWSRSIEYSPRGRHSGLARVGEALFIVNNTVCARYSALAGHSPGASTWVQAISTSGWLSVWLSHGVVGCRSRKSGQGEL